MLRIAIVEDDVKYARKLEDYIERYSQQYHLDYSCDYYENGLALLEEKPVYDLILMDIKMPYIDGMKLAQKLREWDQDFALIFITNMVQYAIKGYEVNALDFMVKPVQYYDFEIKFKKAVDYYKKHRDVKITINMSESIRRVSVRDIRYIEVMNHMLTYHLKDEKHETYGQLNKVEEELQPHNFVRCHQSYLVNLRYVLEVHKDYIIVGQDRVPVSRRRKREFMQRLTDYMGSGF